MSLRTGLTGGLASGKTTVAEMFASRGAYVMYADKVGHALMQPGEAVYQQIVKRFGDSIINPDRTINRAHLAEIAFGNGLIEDLNRIVHPAVGEAMQRWLAEMSEFDPKSVCVFEAALILEAGLGKYFDKLIVVTSDAQQKIDRFVRRTLGATPIPPEDWARTLRDAERRIGAQLSDTEKIAAADYVIDNSRALAETERQVSKIFKELQSLAIEKHRASETQSL